MSKKLPKLRYNLARSASYAVVQIVEHDAVPPAEIAQKYQPGKTLITTFDADTVANNFAGLCQRFSQFPAARFEVVNMKTARLVVDRRQILRKS